MRTPSQPWTVNDEHMQSLWHLQAVKCTCETYINPLVQMRAEDADIELDNQFAFELNLRLSLL